MSQLGQKSTSNVKGERLAFSANGNGKTEKQANQPTKINLDVTLIPYTLKKKKTQSRP